MRLVCSTTMRGSPPTQPRISKRTAPQVPASITPCGNDDPLGRLPLLVDRVDLLERDADRVRDHRDRVTPGEDQHLRVLEDRLLLERLAEAHRRVVARVGRVVEDLLDPHAIDAPAHAHQRHREQVVGEARVDPGGEAARAAFAGTPSRAARACSADTTSGRRTASSRSTPRSCPRAARATCGRCSGPRARRSVRSGRARRRARRARRRCRWSRVTPIGPIPAISPASRPFFAGSLTMQPTISKSGCATSSRITIFPTKPVPWTITL